MREEDTAHLTRGSSQSEGDLIAVRDALGIPPTGAFDDREIKSHGHFFKARNQIVHELDLKKPGGRGDYTRRTNDG